MRLLLLVMGMFSSMALMAQNTATLKGKLIDSVGKQALKDAEGTRQQVGPHGLAICHNKMRL